MKLLILRVILLFIAVSAFVALPMAFWDWTRSKYVLELLGASSLPDNISDPLIEYWLIWAAFASALLGAFFFVMAISPVRHINLIRLTAALLIPMGLWAWFRGHQLELKPFPYLVDVFTCLIGGPLLLLLTKDLTKTRL